MGVSSLILESPEQGARRVDLFPGTAGDPMLVVPAALRVFTRESQVAGSCVIYHPQRDAVTGEMRVRVKGSIQHDGETVRQLADSLHTFPEPARASTIPLEFPLSLSSLKPGVYSLEVQAVDEVGQQKVAQSVEFTVR
jgi:hypothetical protein